jgi:hypothetical protein
MTEVYYKTDSKEVKMFEIIMLLAFFYAATSQLFPVRPTTTGKTREKMRLTRERISFVRRPERKKRTTPEPLSEAKDRRQCYAHAA